MIIMIMEFEDAEFWKTAILDLAHEDSVEKAKKAIERVLIGETVKEERMKKSELSSESLGQ